MSKIKEFKKKYGDWALVTGASAGIGLEIAEQLAAGGLNVVLVARRQATMERAANRLARDHKVQTRVVPMDLTRDGAVDQLADTVNDLTIGVLVLNAGVEVNGEFIDSAPEAQAALVKLNVLVPTLMARHFGARMAERGRGAILLTSSLFAYQGMPYFASYAASKAYILLLGEGLHVELKRRGVDVTVLSPGLTKTEMAAGIPMRWSRLPMVAHDPKKVARVGLRNIGRSPSVIPGLLNRFYAFQNRLLPRITPTKLFGFLLRRAYEPGALRE